MLQFAKRIKRFVFRVAKKTIYSKAGEIAFPDVPRPPLRPVSFSLAHGTGRAITLQVAQGLGDIFWVYQKFAPYFDVINFEICQISAHPVQNRSLSWMSIFPKLGSAKPVIVSAAKYGRLAKSYSRLQDVLDAWTESPSNSLEYCCNRWLEEGDHLAEIDPGAQLEVSVPLLIDRTTPLPFPEYLLLYISGSTTDPSLQDKRYQVWPIENYLQLIRGIRERTGKDLPVCMIGADFDRKIMDKTSTLLRKSGIDCRVICGEAPHRVLHLLKQASLFVGYQSGLNIVADNLDVPQLMLYFNYLAPMKYTWCKRENEGRLFLAETFSMSPDQILRKHDFAFLNTKEQERLAVIGTESCLPRV
jgi:hypothetical protein